MVLNQIVSQLQMCSILLLLLNLLLSRNGRAGTSCFHQCHAGTMNPMYRRSGGDLTVVPPSQQHSSFQSSYTAAHHSRNNGYLSDIDRYIRDGEHCMLSGIENQEAKNNMVGT